MKRHKMSVLAIVLAGFAAESRADFTIDFSDKNLPANSYYNGSDGAGGFTSGGAFFNNNYDSTYKVWDGWSYSNVNDTTTAGYTNQFAAVTGTGVGGHGIYGVAYDGYPNDSYINLPGGTDPVSVYLTNTTYAYLSMLNGDQFAKKFTTGDFLTVQVRGFAGKDATGATLGEVDFDLARYAATTDHPVNVWSLVDLSKLAGSASLGFTMVSSDVGAFGINTPTYFAMDNLTVRAVPEPASLALLALGALGAWARRLAPRKRAA